MEYLSFDIECSDGVHICEFGYVIFDEQYNLIAKENFLVNPQSKFNLIGRKGGRDIFLHYSEEEYSSAPTFPEVYYKIKGIVENPDYTIIGFSMQNDRKFLSTATERYDLPALEFTFLDFQDFYRAYSNSPKNISVSMFVEQLGIEGLTLHKSDDDSYAVMLGLKAISEKEKLSLPETLVYLQDLKEKHFTKHAEERAKQLRQKLENGHDKTQKSYLGSFVYRIEKKIQGSLSKFPAVCIGMNYRKHYYSEFLALVELLYKKGYKYAFEPYTCDIFVKFDYEENGTIVEDLSLTAAYDIIKKSGRLIEIVELEDFLKRLSIDRQSLIDKDILSSVKPLKKEMPRFTSYKDNAPSATIGDMLRQSGIDLTDITTGDKGEN